LAGFAHALQARADALELDVHLTRDGQVVVAHDKTGLRVAGDSRALIDCTYDEVSCWNVARYRGGATARMPLLGEVLSAFPGVQLNVDLKAKGEGLVLKTLALLREHRACERVRLASFFQRSLDCARRLRYEGPTSLGPGEVFALRFAPEPVAALMIRGTAAQVPTAKYGVRFDTEAMVERAHRLGLVVHFWTINEVAEAKALRALGADGIVTDDPARMVLALA
jgi:glycerophosphoryl diester phosphodiesterase